VRQCGEIWVVMAICLCEFALCSCRWARLRCLGALLGVSNSGECRVTLRNRCADGGARNIGEVHGRLEPESLVPIVNSSAFHTLLEQSNLARRSHN
jgi:hypothetical protein